MTEPATIPALVAATVAAHGDRVAVDDGTTSRTWTELADEVRSFAGALVASGIEPGDRVSIWAPNSLRWIVALLGLEHAGATLVPINTRFKGNEAAVILQRSRAK